MDLLLRDRVGTLCEQLSRWPSLRTSIRDGGGEHALTELLALLTGTTDPEGPRVSELVDAIEDACARQGLAGLTTREVGSPGGIPALPPGMSGAPEIMGWTCPLGRCNRVVTPDETAHPPTCAAHGPEGRMKPYPPSAS
ncbi:hypothetical protein [Kitasatospora purpeofusca]|uniref:hypothetical protein n=1 Tax=Kitasatospora purpeofusca TaxID=67352 RepID=UPI003F4AC55E